MTLISQSTAPADHRSYWRAPARIAAFLLSALVVASGLVVGVGIQEAKADNGVDLSVSATRNILAGNSVDIALTVSNSSSNDYYNLTFSYRLPKGVTLRAGTTSPAALGEPTIINVPDVVSPPEDAADGYQVLIWRNVSDLVAAGSHSIGFTADVDPEMFPVGSSFLGAASGSEGSVFVHSNPRLVPSFDSQGNVNPASYTASDSASPLTTQVSALEVSLTEPSPESELMRGVHDATTEYTMTVRNTQRGATTGVEVVSYLADGLEFLGCGGVDNGTLGDEHAASGPLGVKDTVSGCLPAGTTITSVDTVALSPGEVAGVAAGLYTRVVWSVGDMAAGATRTIKYAAGVPLRKNTLGWPGTAPAAESKLQASNLDNNTGAETRHVDGGQSFSSTAIATGEYQGEIADGTDRTVSDSGNVSVVASDLSVVKSADVATFDAGAVATFTLRLRTSEYNSASAMTITDTMQNGLCPLFPDGTVDLAGFPAECQMPGDAVTGAIVESAVMNGDGSFTMVLTPDPNALAAGADESVITYTALMRGEYSGSLTDPTAAGDSFTNRVQIEGTTTREPATSGGQVDETATVTDDSRAVLSSTAPTISKKVLPRTPGVTDCADEAGNYVADSGAEPPRYRLGDRICFELGSTFASGSHTKNAALTDFVPVGTRFDSWSFGTGTGITAGQVAMAPPADVDDPFRTWNLGAIVNGTDRFVGQGARLTMYVSAIVTSTSTNPDGVDITANLMKYRQESTTGTVLALRAQAGFGIAPAPVVTLDKGIASVNGVTTSNPDATATVREGDTVAYRIDVANAGTALAGNDFDVNDIEVWDALPFGISCADVVTGSLLPDAGECFDDGDTGYPANSATPAERSMIAWTIHGPLSAGSTAGSLDYEVKVPAEVSVSTRFTNTASVVAFTSPNTDGTDTEYYPQDSLGATAAAKWNTAEASDTATVALPGATVAKTAATGITEAGNSATTQAVVGETITYTYGVTVPAGTTVYNGVLTDPLPTGLLRNGSATATLNGGALPGGVSVSADGILTFPAVYNNDSAVNHVFTVTLAAVVDPAGAFAHLTSPTSRASHTVPNTATFRSNDSDGGTALAARNASASVTVVTPNPTLSKSADKSVVLPDEEVTFTLTAGNVGASRPIAHDVIVVDCLPSGFSFGAFLATPSDVTTTDAGLGAHDCAADARALVWDVGSMAASASANVVLRYTATVVSPAVSAAAYTNSATLTASTLNNNQNDATVERVFTSTATHTATIGGAATTKHVSLDPDAVTETSVSATSGDTVHYQVEVTLPKQVQFFSAAVIDVVPSGITPPTAAAAQVSCLTVETTPQSCDADLSGLAPMTASGNTVGWMLGDIVSHPLDRVVTVSYSTTVTGAAGNTAGKTLTNTAGLKWFNAVQSSPPTLASASFGVSGDTGTATVTVLQPNVSITKAVADADGPITSAQPTDTFTYTVRVTNANGANNSSAYDTTVTDVVPTGIVVDESTLPAGATLSGQHSTNGGGTITWQIPTLAKGATATLTYEATLAPSTVLTGSALENTATLVRYSSQTTADKRTFTPATTRNASITPDFPHIALTKSAAAGPAYVGTAHTWTITIANTGDGDALDVIAMDILPANWSYEANSATRKLGSGSGTAFEPTAAADSGVETLTFPALAIAAGETYTVTYRATPDAAALTDAGHGVGTAHTNTVKASAKDLSGASTYNTSTSFVGPDARADTHIGSADLDLTKAAGTRLIAGATTDDAWTITVKNLSVTDTAVGPFTVTDTPGTLPSGIAVLAASGDGWSCTTPNATTGAFTCGRTDANDTLAPGASFPAISIKASADANVGAGTSVENTASVSARTYDPDPDNNEASQTITTVAEADLSISKAAAGSFKAGTQATWTISVQNLGPSVSRGPIVVTDTLPATGLSDVTVDGGEDWACGPVTATVTCTLAADLPLGAAPVITVTGTVDSAFVGNLANTAAITEVTTTDPITNNNSSTTTRAVDTATAITLAKTLKTSPLVPGSEAVYELKVTNTGIADARNVRIVDPLPAGLGYVSAASTTGTWNCSDALAAGITTVTCSLTGTLGTGTSNTATVELTVAVPSSLTGDVTNTATASADNASDATSSTGASGTSGQADLGITKTHPAGPVIAGNSLSYTVTVTNHGPTDSPAGIVVVDNVPSGLTPVSASGSGWNCDDPVGQDITCTSTGLLPSDDTAGAITVVVDVPASAVAGTYSNVATVTGALPEPSNATHPNTATDDTVITTDAAVTIAKTVTSGATLVAGTAATYTLTVTNSGPSNAAAVSVTDSLPPGMVGESISGIGWTCTLESMTCTMASMAPGASTITVKAAAASSVLDGTVLMNTGTVEFNDSDGRATDSDTAAVTVAAEADLVLRKSAVHTTVHAGDIASFELVVTNVGASDTVGDTTIVDTLPVGMEFVGVIGAQWTCLAATFDPLTTQVVTCTLADGVPSGGTAPTLTITATIDNALGTATLPSTVTLTNTATVSTGTTETDLTNNIGSADVTVGHSADLEVVKTHSGNGRIGTITSFGIVVTNNGGPSLAEGIVVTDSLHDGLTFVDAAGSNPAWTCSAPVKNAATGGEDVTCYYADLLAPGASTGTLLINAAVEVAGFPSVDNDVVVTATTPDPDLANNAFTDPLTVDPMVDLAVTKAHRGELRVNEAATYVITVRNTGPTAAPGGLSVIDKLPAGLTFVDSSGKDFTCVDDESTVTCSFTGMLATGTSASVELSLMVAEAAFPAVVNEVQLVTLHENLATHSSTDSDLAKVAEANRLPHTGASLPVTQWVTFAALAMLIGSLLFARVRRRIRPGRHRA